MQNTLLTYFFLCNFMAIFEYSENIRELACIRILCIWDPEHFISYKIYAVKVWSGHIGFRDDLS